MFPLAGLLLLFAGAAPAPLLHIDVFRAGEGGYHGYRIPALVTAPNGTLLAFAEARKESLGDPGAGDIDLVLKRSTDRGATWSGMTVLDDPGEKWSASNPTPVVDRQRRRVWILFNRWEPGFGTARAQPGTSNNQTWARWSDDNGRTWSPARDLTRSAREYAAEGAMFTGPGGAIQMRNGRLVVPASARTGPRVDSLRSYVIYSDDHGETWQRGARLEPVSDENQVVELGRGTLLMDARQGGKAAQRWVALSRDGGATWARVRPGQTVTPVATAIERLGKRLIWTGPKGPQRNHLVIRVSSDEGTTWPVERPISEGPAAYSDLAILADGTIGVLWERGVDKGYQFITFTRVSRRFLDGR